MACLPSTLSCVHKIHPLGFGELLPIHLHYYVETAVGMSADGLWSNLQLRAFRMVLSVIVLFAYLVKTHPDFCGVKPLGLRMGSVYNLFGGYIVFSSHALMEHDMLNSPLISSFICLFYFQFFPPK